MGKTFQASLKNGVRKTYERINAKFARHLVTCGMQVKAVTERKKMGIKPKLIVRVKYF